MAAGLGFKTFTTGEVLTAGDVNGYLMQGVLVFASAAARNAAITSPQEGQFAYTKDTNGLWYYDGAAWVASGATGDIEGVTAGTGISGGGTSGTVTITNSMATAIDAKGDLIGGTGADAFARLAVGTNGQVLTADSAEATGLKWAAPASGSTFCGVTVYSVSGSVTVPNNTNTILPFNSEAVDTDGFHSTTTNTSRLTVPAGKGGTYAIWAKLEYDGSSANNYAAAFQVNGGTATPYANAVGSSGGTFANAVPMFVVYPLAAGDYVELRARQITGGSILAKMNNEAETIFGMYLLGA